MIKSLKISLSILVVLWMSTFSDVNSQENIESNIALEIDTTFSYQVSKLFPPLSHTKDELKEVNTISDLSRFFKESWIEEYTSVTIISKVNGKAKTAIGKNSTLTDQQKELLNNTDYGAEVEVVIKYYPLNSLTIKEEKIYDFSFVLDPETDAYYSEGEEALNKYFKEYVIDKLPEGLFTGYKFSSVKFQIDQEGRVVNPLIYWSSEDDVVDSLMLEAVCNMPVWVPAKYDDGTLCVQEYSFNLGNMKSCAINLLNLDKTSWSAEEDDENEK